MKKNKKNVSLFCAMILCTLISFAQNDNFGSLISMNAANLDREMQNRGYQFIRADKAGSDVYQNWLNVGRNKCVAVRVSNGLIKSIVDTPSADCRKGNQDNNQNNKDNFSSLIDMRATYLDQEMQNRGYAFIKTVKSGNDSYQNWFSANKNKCVTVRISNGRVKSIVDSILYDCGKGNENNNNDNFSSLIEMRATYLDQEMRNRGYAFIKTVKSGNDSYQNWFSANKNKCVTVRISNGRVKSIVDSVLVDCGKGNENNNNDNFSSLIEMRATYLDQEMQNRGYAFIKTVKSGNDSYQNWFSANKNKCVTVRISNGRVKSIVDSVLVDCGKGDQGIQSSQYKDVKGWEAKAAYSTLNQRGFREIQRYKKDRLWIVWRHNQTGQCMKTGEDGGRIKEVQESEKCN